MHYDIIVIGSGPAGLSAALTARARNKTVLVVGNRWQDSPLARAGRVDNYLGLPSQSGADLLETFHAHAKEAGVALLEGRALSALPWNGFQVSVGSQVLSAGALILAPGVVRQKKFPGEAEYLGRGVSYCATCDGMFYRGRRIAVLSGSAQGVEESAFLAGLAAELDYYRLKAHDMTGLDARIHPKEEKPRAIARDGEALVLQTDKGEHRYDGIFIFRAAMPLSMLLADLRTEGSYIPVDRGMRTNIPGVFAAGDCTGKPLQVPKAVGEGNIAAISAAEYIAKRG